MAVSKPRPLTLRFSLDRCLIISVLFFALCSTNLAAQDVLHSGVSPEFMDGLHTKFLNHAAHKMNLELDLLPMPFARRVQALRNGDIDIMVGMREGMQTRDDFVYLEPSYETLKTGFFILKDNYHKVEKEQDLNGLLLGTSIVRSSDLSQTFSVRNGMELVQVSSLQQKVDMLLKGRTDMFHHFIHSTLPVLKQRGLQDTIKLARVQRPQSVRYYFAMSKKSPYFGRRHEFEAMLRTEVADNAFAAIRENHYATDINPTAVAEKSKPDDKAVNCPDEKNCEEAVQ